VTLFSNKEEALRALGRLRLRACIPGEGLHIEVCYHDSDGEKLDNESDLSFQLSEAAVETLAGRAVKNEADAKAFARENETRVRNAIAKWLQERGLSSPGGRPRVLLPTDLD
jgi:hypothetical protein